jgi:hypothetical protein
VLTSVNIVPQEEIINIPENMKANALKIEKKNMILKFMVEHKGLCDQRKRLIQNF